MQTSQYGISKESKRTNNDTGTFYINIAEPFLSIVLFIRGLVMVN
jgi:hypothetical protein